MVMAEGVLYHKLVFCMQVGIDTGAFSVVEPFASPTSSSYQYYALLTLTT